MSFETKLPAKGRKVHPVSSLGSSRIRSLTVTAPQARKLAQDPLLVANLKRLGITVSARPPRQLSGPLQSFNAIVKQEFAKIGPPPNRDRKSSGYQAWQARRTQVYNTIKEDAFRQGIFKTRASERKGPKTPDLIKIELPKTQMKELSKSRQLVTRRRVKGAKSKGSRSVSKASTDGLAAFRRRLKAFKDENPGVSHKEAVQAVKIQR